MINKIISSAKNLFHHIKKGANLKKKIKRDGDGNSEFRWP